MNKKLIQLVSGELCSGKGTYCNTLKQAGYEIISVSAIVRALSGKSSRADLVKTGNLDKQILNQLILLIEKNFKLKIPVVVDGIRQVSIAQGIVDKFGLINVEVTWLDIDEVEQRKRFETRAAAKDSGQDFDSLLQLDKDLGTMDVKKWMQSI